jgi:hypothetical protein
VIFAELEYDIHYSDLHEELVEYICSHFDKVESGLQGDSWIWVFEGDNVGEEKVAIDTFSAMKHQVKADTHHSVLVGKVITVLKTKYTVRVYDDPELEGHEDF